MSGLYHLSWLVFEHLTCPSDPSVPCEVCPSENLRPCHECCHCHDQAQDIENLLERTYEAGKAGQPGDVVLEWWKSGRRW